MTKSSCSLERAAGRQAYWEGQGTTLILDDALAAMRQLPTESVDCIFADPPYNLSNGGVTCHAGRMVSVDKGAWDKSSGVLEDHRFALQWLGQCRRLLKPNGTLWVSGTNHNIYGVGFALQRLGYRILNDICWYKRNAPPNLSCRYFTHSHETILWAAKSERSKHTFNYDAMRQANAGRQMRSMWDISSPEKAEKIHGKHPTQKPLALLNRIILASTETGQVVLDPFVGSGTTCVSALLLGRRSIGIDVSADYLGVAIKRLEDAIADRAARLPLE